MTHTENDLENKKNYIIDYIFIGVLILVSLFQIYRILFIQPTKMDFVILLLSMWFAVTIYLVDIKQITKKSEKKTLWIVIRFIGIIILALLFWSLY